LGTDKAQLTSDKTQLTAQVTQLTDQVSKQTQCIAALDANAAELQRISASPACAVRYIETVSDFDVRHLLPKVKAPTLVMHSGTITGCRWRLAVNSRLGYLAHASSACRAKNHLILEQDAGGPIFLEEVRNFLSTG